VVAHSSMTLPTNLRQLVYTLDTVPRLRCQYHHGTPNTRGKRPDKQMSPDGIEGSLDTARGHDTVLCTVGNQGVRSRPPVDGSGPFTGRLGGRVTVADRLRHVAHPCPVRSDFRCTRVPSDPPARPCRCTFRRSSHQLTRWPCRPLRRPSPRSYLPY